MSTATTTQQTPASHTNPTNRTPATRRIVGVIAEPQSYRDLGYLLLGLPLGALWFTALVSGLSVAISMLVVALLGIPMLLGMWYLTRWLANVERSTVNLLLGQHLDLAPMASPDRGNPWVRLRAMSRDRDRWRELGFLLLRFPVGIATFVSAVASLATPVMVAYAPFNVRYVNDHPFGNWAQSARMEDIASSSWAWFLVPFGVGLLVASFHLLSALAHACGRWTTAWLGADDTPA